MEEKLPTLSSSRALPCSTLHSLACLSGIDDDVARTSILTGTILPRTQFTYRRYSRRARHAANQSRTIFPPSSRMHTPFKSLQFPQLKVRRLFRIAFQINVDTCPKLSSTHLLGGYLAEAHQRWPLRTTTSIPNDVQATALHPIITNPHKIAHFQQRVREVVYGRHSRILHWEAREREEDSDSILDLHTPLP